MVQSIFDETRSTPLHKPRVCAFKLFPNQTSHQQGRLAAVTAHRRSRCPVRQKAAAAASPMKSRVAMQQSKRTMTSHPFRSTHAMYAGSPLTSKEGQAGNMAMQSPPILNAPDGSDAPSITVLPPRVKKSSKIVPMPKKSRPPKISPLHQLSDVIDRRDKRAVVESILKGPASFQLEARRFTNQVFSALVQHGAKSASTIDNMLTIPDQLRPLLLPDLPLPITITGTGLGNDDKSENTLFLPPAHVALLTTLGDSILHQAAFHKAPVPESLLQWYNQQQQPHAVGETIKAEDYNKMIDLFRATTFNNHEFFLEPTLPKIYNFLQFLGPAGTGKSTLNWVLFLFCVANDIDAAVSINEASLVFRSAASLQQHTEQQQFAVYDFTFIHVVF